MKVIILGADGMLGNDLGKVFYDLGPYLLDKLELDVTNERAINNVFLKLKPDVVINAAAYTDVDGCEVNKDLAMQVNGNAPGYLAKASKEVGAVFLHFSTDYVFSGDNKDGYNESDEPSSPINFYGETKFAGEKAVMECGGKFYLIRTSWLFGDSSNIGKGKHVNFVETMIRLAKDKDEIRVVSDQHGKPTYTLDLAEKVKKLIDKKGEFGIYHLANEPATTWFEFAKEIIDKWSRKADGTVRIPGIVPVDSDEFPRPAKRPKYSVLLNTKLPPMRSWKDALNDYLGSRD
ncbi:MAG: dTDP-4-dehydrorhamnose reductase [Candidatus Spechtbacteria bacterium RIFCSPHIGHO2_02_FULL_43_15b]|uniref:dTDP-4-dehydrorhamnose reductase n=1 Tax=Candidatus Spechtbacteria bacterium RIFCSPHIGHO2_01_FULL_43_30 TaxID=1802158 RepID=A0A1G2H7J5_9BACT|nr:MAG: dTDP-4-dehydrorhamnose reductase [Candidatus Spechtbacteria bacterium RIFCSPHIGHO2_01_FULL_43_30]OGZ58575.1 MAG: dTDP-4-dehydrorhamnose reductase [Candidatus Spechtbacteria bacterium RIFCSPHIGHO2_02_FULL_43_15b]